MKREKFAAVFFAAAIVLAFAASAGAVDGTIEINQAKVLAVSGFPFIISNPGSYRLTGNLTAPASTSGINVTAPHVTIDLNGFLITGPGTLSGVVNGISAQGIGDVTVENGTLTGFGDGVDVGSFGIVRNVHADANGVGIEVGNNSVVEGCTANNSTSIFGIFCSAACAISGNTANGNPGQGIDCSGNGCLISGNTADANSTHGIECNGSGCVISGNTVVANSDIGIYCAGSGCLISDNAVFANNFGIAAGDTSTGYRGNVLKNTSANVSPGSGTSLGNNLCSGTAC